jgi:hypothetical protein
VTIEPQSSQRVNAHGKAMSSEAIFYLACNTDNPHKIFVSFGPYQGTALDNIDNASRPVVFVTKDQDGSSQKFPEEMHYYSGDSEWRMTVVRCLRFSTSSIAAACLLCSTVVEIRSSMSL